MVYFTEQELHNNPHVLDSVRSDGYEVVVVTDQQKSELEQQIQTGGPAVRIIEQYVEEFNASFQYSFVALTSLTAQERQIFAFTPQIVALVGINSSQNPVIRISETMRLTNDYTQGVWDSHINAIVIKRSQLATLEQYAATLLHEVAHQTSGTTDATRDFERVLTKYLGLIAAQHLQARTTSTDLVPETKNRFSLSRLLGKK